MWNRMWTKGSVIFCGLPLKSLTYIDTRCIHKITAETRSHCILESIQLQSRSCKDLVSALFCSISFIWSSCGSCYMLLLPLQSKKHIIRNQKYWSWVSHNHNFVTYNYMLLPSSSTCIQIRKITLPETISSHLQPKRKRPSSNHLVFQVLLLIVSGRIMP